MTRAVALTSRCRGFEATYAGEAIAYMANLPLSVNIFNQVSA